MLAKPRTSPLYQEVEIAVFLGTLANRREFCRGRAAIGGLDVCDRRQLPDAGADCPELGHPSAQVKWH